MPFQREFVVPCGFSTSFFEGRKRAAFRDFAHVSVCDALAGDALASDALAGDALDADALARSLGAHTRSRRC